MARQHSVWETQSPGATPFLAACCRGEGGKTPSLLSAAVFLAPRRRCVAAVARRSSRDRLGSLGLERATMTDVSTGGLAFPFLCLPHCAFLLIFAGRLGQDERGVGHVIGGAPINASLAVSLCLVCSLLSSAATPVGGPWPSSAEPRRSSLVAVRTLSPQRLHAFMCTQAKLRTP